MYVTLFIRIKRTPKFSLKKKHAELCTCRSNKMIKFKLLKFFRSDSTCYLREIVHGKLNLGEIFCCCAACNVEALS